MIGLLRQAFFLCAPVLVLSWQGAVAGQQPPRVEVGVRPSNVRIGEAFWVTVRVAADSWPEAVDLQTGAAAEVIDFKDRTSTRVGIGSRREYVFERAFELLAVQPGVVDRITVRVAFPEVVHEHTVPEVTVAAAALYWGRADPPGGVSPRAADGSDRNRPGGRDAPDDGPSPAGFGPIPNQYGNPGDSYGRGTYDSPYGGPPYGGGTYDRPYGRAAYVGGWAETAASDPAWPQLLPRWDEYRSRVNGDEEVALLEVGLTPQRVYVGQQLTLIASASFAPGVGYGPGARFEFHAAQPSNGWIVELPPVLTPPVFGAGGGLGGEARVFLQAVFPTSSGLLMVDPAFVLYSADNAFRGSPVQDTVIGEPLDVQVLAIPQHEAPPGWGGAVGRYQVSAWLARRQVEWGESDLLTVEISGAGYVPALVRPDPGPMWGGGIRPLDERSWVQVRDGVVGGSKRFTWVVAPGEPGAMRIGPVHFSFFDPYIGAFGQVASEELVLDVGPYPGQDLRN